MNREIKFRAWYPKYKKMSMVTGYMWEEDGSDYVNLEKWSYDEKILMQYTGLKDKNNKEIYEGDIVKCPDLNPPEYTNTLSIVEYHASCFCYRDISSNKIESIYGFIGLSERDDDVEIIGNTFENPELLK